MSIILLIYSGFGRGMGDFGVVLAIPVVLATILNDSIHLFYLDCYSRLAK